MAELERDYRAKGLLVVGPTQHYGYVAGGAPASPAQELADIDTVRKQDDNMLPTMAVPVSDEDAVEYRHGRNADDRARRHAGKVRLFHPGT